MGKVFDLSISEFNLAMGFYSADYIATLEYLDSYCDFPSDFDALSVFAEWSIDGAYDPSSSKDVSLKNPALKYLHRFLALTFSRWQFSSPL